MSAAGIVCPAPPPVRRPLTDADVAELSDWLATSPLPAWPRPKWNADSPVERLQVLIAEWQAMRAMLDVVGEFAGDFNALLERMKGETPA